MINDQRQIHERTVPVGHDFSMRFTNPIKKTLAILLAGLLLTSAASITIGALEPHGTGIKMRKWLINDPDYTFSEAYQTSVWYENFSSLELGENDRNNVLRVAVSQLGYHEGDSEADFHGMNTGATGNFMEYGRLLVPNWNNNSFDWCACFVNWCLNQARIDKASSEISCRNWIAELKAMEMWQPGLAHRGTYLPKPADFIFFDWKDSPDAAADHIGLVLYATSTHVYTIEGNTRTNDVALRSYSLTDPQILGYGTPPYDEGDEPTMDFSYAAGMPTGIYIVGQPSLNLTDASGENPTDSVPLGSMVRLLSTSDGLALVTYKDKTGYLPASSLCLMTQEFTLIYDANGGQNPPSEMPGLLAEPVAVTDASPTKEGDTFLGWTTVLYNRKVHFKPGDPIRLSQDTTLYAVWEKHSKELAKAAASLGLLPEYEWPSSIRNSGAILLGTLKGTEIMTDCAGTKPVLASDAELGNVFSFPASGGATTLGTTFTYGALCEVLRLAPKTCEGTTHIILRVKDVSGSHLSMKLLVNGQVLSDGVPLAEHSGWQYVAFGLNGSGLRGDISTIRAEWTSESADSILQIADIWITPNSTVKDAVLAGKYVYPDMEIRADETAAETDTETEPVSETAPPENTEDTETIPPDTETKTDTGTEEESDPAKPEKSGCFSMIRTSAWVGAVALAAVPVVLVKRKDSGDTEP